MTKKRIAGIDFSITGPSITICLDESRDFSFDNTITFFLTGTKKFQKSFIDNKLIGHEFPHYDCPQDRFDGITDYFIQLIQRFNVEHALIEDYAFGGKGKVFNLAENTGLLKHKLWKINIPFELRAPSAIKKFSTGKGNANKDAMYSAFLSDTNVDLVDKLDYTKSSIDGPIADIVDSYFMCKMNYYERVK